MKGSVRDLSWLVGDLKSDNSRLWEVLPVIYHYLPRTSETLDVGEGTETASFLALLLLDTGLKSPEQLKIPRIFDSLREHWVVIWEACRSLIEGYAGRVRLADKRRSIHHSISTGLLMSLCSYPGFLRILGSTNGFISSITRIWRAEIGWFVDPPTLFTASTVLWVMFESDRSLFDIFFASLGNSFDEVARLCVQRVIATGTGPQIPCSILQSDIAIMSLCGENDSLHRSLMVADCMSAVTHAMSRLASHSEPYNDFRAPITCVRFSLTYLSSIIDVDGASRVVLALEGRTLISMFKTRFIFADPNEKPSKFADDELCREYTRTLELITPYLVYRSVLRHARKSVKTIISLDLERKMESFLPRSQKSFWTAWTAFKQYTMDRAACKTATSGTFSKMKELRLICGDSQVCGNPRA